MERPTGLIPWFSKLREILTLFFCITLSSSMEKPTHAQDVALVKKFQKFFRRVRFGKSSTNDDSSSRDYKKRTCHKCKKPGYYMSGFPLWEK